MNLTDITCVSAREVVLSVSWLEFEVIYSELTMKLLSQVEWCNLAQTQVCGNLASKFKYVGSHLGYHICLPEHTKIESE